VRLNINETVQVKLTKAGAETWNKWESQYENLTYTKPKYKQKGDVLKESMWHLFQVFGNSIHMGCEVPFKDCEIIIGDF
jgi:hypothetical protein